MYTFYYVKYHIVWSLYIFIPMYIRAAIANAKCEFWQVWAAKFMCRTGTSNIAGTSPSLGRWRVATLGQVGQLHLKPPVRLARPGHPGVPKLKTIQPVTTPKPLSDQSVKLTKHEADPKNMGIANLKEGTTNLSTLQFKAFTCPCSSNSMKPWVCGNHEGQGCPPTTWFISTWGAGGGARCPSLENQTYCKTL